MTLNPKPMDLRVEEKAEHEMATWLIHGLLDHG